MRRNRNRTRYFKFSKCSKQPLALLDSKLCVSSQWCNLPTTCLRFSCWCSPESLLSQLDDLSSEKGNRMPDPQNIRRYLQGNAKHEAATLYAKDIQNGKEVSRWHEHAACLAENPVPKRKFAIQPRAGALPAAYTPSPWYAQNIFIMHTHLAATANLDSA